MLRMNKFGVTSVLFSILYVLGMMFPLIGICADSRQDDQQRFVTSFDLSAGTRKDNLKWNVAGDSTGHNPNIISELTWEDVKSLQIRGKGQVVYEQHFIVEGKIAYAQISSGDNQDSDYEGDNRTSESSRSNNDADKGYMNDFSLNAGYQIDLQEFMNDLPSGYLMVTPLVGYAFNGQNLRMQNGYQTIDEVDGDIGPFDGLNATYDTQWYGPWLGIQLQGKFKRLTGSLRWEYHWMQYYAQADWNLRTDFEHPKSFEHTADNSKGSFLSCRLGYDLSQSWQVNLDVDFYDYKTNSGTVRAFLADGTQTEQQLNEVTWDSYSLNAGLRYTF